MYKDFAGKKIYHCYAMGGRINFQSQNISLCHSLECDDPTIEFSYGTDNLAEVYVQGVEQILKEVQEGKRCAQCSMRKEASFVVPKVRVITLNVNTQCNCKCLYCCSHSVNQNKSVSIVPHIAQLENSNMIEQDCFFDFGGGEPTIDPYFEENLSYVSERDYVIRVNTNALLFSDILAQYAKKDSDMNIRISVDAGTEATYLRVKGNDQYHKVWENIGKYRQYTENIAIKYVLCRHNTSLEDLEGFVAACVRYDINTIYVDIDHDAYVGKAVEGWSQYTREMYEAAYNLVAIAKQNGIEPLIGYVWTAGDAVQDTYDYNQVKRTQSGQRYITSGNEICLPKKYEANRAQERELVFDKYNNLKHLFQVLQGTRVVLYGAGYYGGKMYEAMSGKLEVIGIVDSNPELWGRAWNGMTIMKPDKLADMQGINVVITSGYADEIMTLLNQKGLQNIKEHIYYITMGDFDYAD